MAISLVVVSATPRATNRVSAARSTRALVSSAFPIAPVYEAPRAWERLRPPCAGRLRDPGRRLAQLLLEDAKREHGRHSMNQRQSTTQSESSGADSLHSSRNSAT